MAIHEPAQAPGARPSGEVGLPKTRIQMEESRYGIIAWIVLGAIAGFITNLLMGGSEGVVATILLGIVGAVVGATWPARS